jgi:hypothetical protein
MNEKNGAESGNESEFPDTYCLSVSDRVIVDAAIQLLDKIAQAPCTRPAQLVPVAKALYILLKPSISLTKFSPNKKGGSQ